MYDKTRNKWMIVFAFIVFLLNAPSLVGFVRGLPVETGDGVNPLGTYFEGVPGLYNEEFVNGGVYETIWVSAERFTQGENIYDLKRVGVGPYRYPPLILIMGLSTLLLGWVKGYYVWTIINLVLVYVTGKLIIPRVLAKKQDRAYAWFFLFMSTPLIMQIAWGHYIILIMVISALLLKGLVDHDRTSTAIGAGLLASASFLTPFVAVPIISLAGLFPIMLSTGVVMATFTPLLFNTPSLWGLMDIKGLADGGTLGLTWQSSVNTLSLSLQYGWEWGLGITLLGLGLLGIFWLRVRNGERRSVDLTALFLVTLACFLLVNPWLSNHYVPLSLLVLLPILQVSKAWFIALYLLTNTRLSFLSIELFKFQLVNWLLFIGIATLFFVTWAVQIGLIDESVQGG